MSPRWQQSSGRSLSARSRWSSNAGLGPAWTLASLAVIFLGFGVGPPSFASWARKKGGLQLALLCNFSVASSLAVYRQEHGSPWRTAWPDLLHRDVTPPAPTPGSGGRRGDFCFGSRRRLCPAPAPPLFWLKGRPGRLRRGRRPGQAARAAPTTWDRRPVTNMLVASTRATAIG